MGLGYVGLPLTVELSKIYKVLGFDVDPSRINELEACFDRTGEVCGDDIRQLSKSFIRPTLIRLRDTTSISLPCRRQ